MHAIWSLLIGFVHLTDGLHQEAKVDWPHWAFGPPGLRCDDHCNLQSKTILNEPNHAGCVALRICLPSFHSHELYDCQLVNPRMCQTVTGLDILRLGHFCEKQIGRREQCNCKHANDFHNLAELRGCSIY